jgi:hypothetical protein
MQTLDREQKLLSNEEAAQIDFNFSHRSIVFSQVVGGVRRGEVEKHLWWQGVHLPCIILSLRGSGGTFKYY